MVNVDNPNQLSPRERQLILANCAKANFSLYQINSEYGEISKRDLIQFGLQLGLQHMDQNLCADEAGVSSITVADQGRANEYIPYTDRPINWHTDGYYNNAAQRIQGMVLHCVQPAPAGGENRLLDPEIAYIEMRDADPDMVYAFMQEDAMTIPANLENGVEIRSAQSGPVFSINHDSGSLHMRYTARTRSIEWKQDAMTQKAVQFMKDLLNQDLDYKFCCRLEAGEGMFSNNILHNRSAFQHEDAGRNRLIYRVRYYDRINDRNLAS